MHIRANGENFPVEVWLSKVEFDHRILINTIWRDLTEKKKIERTLRKNIEEKEILLKEIHHRVKNNLQIITSLLNLQTNTIEDEKVKAILFQSKTRIESMCKVHEMLYSSKNLSSINYGDYLKDLLDKLIVNAKGESNQILLQLDVNNLFLNINTAIPLGLLINELVTNSLKYAFPENGKGTITITINSINDVQYELIYGDDGIGYAPEISFKDAHSLGFQLIDSLSEQLNGVIKRDFSKKGTHYSFVFEKL
jgi:two-component sensor histidine kinase